MYRQYQLRLGSMRMVTWLRSASALAVGSCVRLKGKQSFWTVEIVGRMELAAPPERSWRVGGLT